MAVCVFGSDLGLNLLQTSSLYSEGQNEVSMIDREFLILFKTLKIQKVKDSYISKYIYL